MQLTLARFKAPVCELLIVTDQAGVLRALEFADHEPRMHELITRHQGQHTLKVGEAPAAVAEAMQAYFAGNIEALDKLPAETGGTPFQRQVWAALRTIPAGQTMSYGQQAKQIGRPKASRAVGAANGANPIAIVIPCHRVIGANGSLTGYGGGLEHKRWLLDHEQRFAPQRATAVARFADELPFSTYAASSAPMS